MDFKENKVEDLERIYADVNSEPIQISYAVVKSITKDFAQVIGHGAFGVVYLGALRNGLVAVKKVAPSKDFSDTQFLLEVKCLKKIKHKNIVRFLGYCADTQGLVMEIGGKLAIGDVQQRFLCFEYVPNGNLDYYLQEKNHGYEWNIRYQIIKGICQGLYYLHQLRIYHLDLKPANVLLGAQMEPKITDFGLSRCIDGNQSTIFTVNVQGTPGYIAPELIDERKISLKSDIFSLGIIMTRLLTGHTQIIPENWHELLNVDCRQMKKCIKIAQICTDHDPYKRPTISDILYQLDETETVTQMVRDLVVSEPSHDPATILYQVVNRFRTLPAHNPGEDLRPPEKLPVECPKWKLEFLSEPKLPIYTREKIEDANYNPLEVILVDAETGRPSSALLNMLQIELVPLLGNFPRDCWDADDFQRGVVEDVEGNRPLLAGEHRLMMWDGRATLNKLWFTDDSRMCGCMFRLGVRVLPGSYQGPRIIEAMTGAFMVRDRHGDELHYNEHYKWQLVFQSQPQLPIYIGSSITDVIGNPLEIIIVDLETGSPLELPMEIHIKLVSLIGISLPHDWTLMDPRLVKGLLSGDVILTMRDGRVTVNELQFTDNLQLTHEFCIGVCVVSCSYNGPGRILEGMTKAFKVLQVPTKMTKKHYPPALGDEVWRLEGISWGGLFYNRLTQNGIRNVLDFVIMLAVKPDELRAIIGKGSMEDCTWQLITEHASKCMVPMKKVYAYSMAYTTIYINSIFDLIKVTFGGVECPRQQLDKAQKELVQQAMREAYEHRHSLQEVKYSLAFKSPPRLPIHTGRRIEDATGNPLEVILVEAKTGLPFALSMDLVIKLVPLFGDFPPDDVKDDWSAEEFRTAIVKPRQENVPLLKDYNHSLTMRDGRATVSELLQFTDDSSWVRCRKFRIGAHVVSRDDGSCRIAEAITEAFVVEDLNRKHYPPVLGDSVWRLEMIDKEGHFHRKLTSNNVHTVQEFRQMLNVMPDYLREILGDTMTHLMWQTTTDHARTCDPGDKMYAYVGESGTIYMDSVFSRLAIVIDGVECPLKMEQPDNAQQIVLLELILEAYEQRHNLQVMEHCDYEIIDPCWLLGRTRAQRKMNNIHTALSDEVWMLRGITWGGVFHKRLRQNNVRTIQDFLRMLAVKSDELRAIIGDGMETDSTWEKITQNARTWVNPGPKVYAYSTVHATIYVNSVFHLVKVEFGNVQCTLQQLDEVQKGLVQQAMREAYDYRQSLKEVKLAWKLEFKSPPRLPIHAGSRIVDAMGNPLEIILVDAKTGSQLSLWMELDIKLVPLLGDSPQDRSTEEFEEAIVKGRHEGVPLLKGDRYLRMRDGRVTVDDLIHFTDDSSWLSCRMFRIGAHVLPFSRGSDDESFRIVEAMTEAFVVGDLNRKHYPPVLDDPVWRLEMIDQDGDFHRKLTSNNIDTVQEFCRMLNVKYDELRAIVGDSMTDRMWDMTTEHAWDCAPGEKVYLYSGVKGTIYVDSIFDLLFMIQIDGVECRPLWELLDNKDQTKLARELILEAYEHRHNLQEVELHADDIIDIPELLRSAEKYELEEPVKLDSQAKPLVDNDKDPVPQAANMGHHGCTEPISGKQSSK